MTQFKLFFTIGGYKMAQGYFEIRFRKDDGSNDVELMEKVIDWCKSNYEWFQDGIDDGQINADGVIESVNNNGLVESEGVFIAYTSVYGHTKQAAEKFAQILKDKGCPKVDIADLAREDTYESIEDAFRYGKLVLATTTYNGEVFPKMREFILHLSERNYQKRTIALIENGSWLPAAAKKMSDMLSSLKDVKILDNKVTIKIAVTQEVVAQLESLAEELLK